MELKNRIKELEGLKFRGNDWLNESIRKGNKAQVQSANHRMQYGRLYQFKYYDPKTRDTLAYWNTNPIVIKIDEVKSKTEGILDVGVNLNFFPHRVKLQFIDAYWNRYNSSYENTTRKYSDARDQRDVKFGYSNFKSLFRNYGVGFTIRRYILKRTKNMYVFSNDIDTWANVMMIKYPRFNPIGITDRDKLFKEYILNK